MNTVTSEALGALRADLRRVEITLASRLDARVAASESVLREEIRNELRRLREELMKHAARFDIADASRCTPGSVSIATYNLMTMSEHKATTRWTHSRGDFLKGAYSREHTWTFDGGLTVPASSSPAAVPKQFCNEANVDPEEAFVAAISSCHLLTYLYLAGKAGFEVASYEDEAVGVLAKNDRGMFWVRSVTLHPRIVYGGEKRPAHADEERLHHAAHDQCFIANSVKTEITVEMGHEP